MENLIKDILNVRYENTTESDLISNYRLFSKFIKFCNEEISQLTDYQQTNIELKTQDYSKEENETNAIIVDRTDLFVVDGQDLIVAFLALAKNVINLTQVDNTINNKANRPFPTFLKYDESSFERIFEHFQASLMNDENLQSEERLPIKDELPEDIIEDVKSYIYALIWSQPYNIECDNFAFNVLNKLLTSAENIDLSEEEKKCLNILKKELSNILKNNQSLVEINNNFRDRDDIREKLQWYIREKINHLLKKDPNYIRRQMYIDSDEFNRRLEEDPFNLCDIIAGLELNYNYTLAHQILQTLLRNKSPNENKDNLISQLVVHTNIILTPEEEEKVRVIFERNNPQISWDDFMKEKNKLMVYKSTVLKSPSLVM